MKNIVAIIVGVVVGMWLAELSSCVRVRAYQERQTLRCEQTHTSEQCRVLSYPACDPSKHDGCHN